MKRNYDALSQKFTGFTLCFSQFFRVLRRICLRAKVGNLVFIILSLLVRTNCVTDKSKGE